MNKTGLMAALGGALFAAVTLLPATGYADDGYRSGTAVTVGYRGYDRGGYDRGRYYGGHRSHYRHHHGYPPYGRAYGYYAPSYYPAPIYYQPYYRNYYPAPSYYGPGNGWSIDLHYFFRD